MIKKIVFICGFLFFVSVSAQEKKKDSADISKEIFEYKPRIFYPYDCSCPDRVIYKELKKGDTEFNPYNYKEIKVIKIEDFNEEEKKIILEQVYRKA